jgi:hypothetical protein
MNAMELTPTVESAGWVAERAHIEVFTVQGEFEPSGSPPSVSHRFLQPCGELLVSNIQLGMPSESLPF